MATEIKSSTSQLEDSLIEEFLRMRGLDPDQTRRATDVESQLHCKHAVAYASGKLAEVECRSRLVRQLHGQA